VLVRGTNVDAYEPNSAWEEENTGVKGVQLVPIEGIHSRATITTPNEVNSCSGNSATGTTVCTANNTDVYIINGSTLTTTLTSGADSGGFFSGGICQNCGVVVDSTTNTAFLGIGLRAGSHNSGYQTLDLATNTFGVPIPSRAGGPVGGIGGISEDIAVDPGRHLILSPGEGNIYEIVQTQPSLAVFENNQSGALPFAFEFDSAAEDCTTGIALSTVELGRGSLFIADLTQATFTPGSPGTWTAPSQIQFLPGFGAMLFGAVGIAVAPGTHLGIATGEGCCSDIGSAIGAIELPSTSGSGTPSVVDFVAAASLPNEPDGLPFPIGGDPHPVTAYVSPTSKKAFALIADRRRPRGFIAVVDLRALLSAPRTAGTHTVDPSVDLIATGVVRYVPVF
jgi:hypothetical protein